jgi:hypothetical protein
MFGVQVPFGSGIFNFPYPPDRLWGPTQPPIQILPRVLSPGVMQQGLESDHSPPLVPTSAEVKQTWIYTSIPPYALMT